MTRWLFAAIPTACMKALLPVCTGDNPRLNVFPPLAISETGTQLAQQIKVA